MNRIIQEANLKPDKILNTTIALKKHIVRFVDCDLIIFVI